MKRHRSIIPVDRSKSCFSNCAVVNCHYFVMKHYFATGIIFASSQFF